MNDCMTRSLITDDGAALVWNGATYGFAFADFEDADSFIQFVATRTGLDPHHQSDESLDRLLAAWQEQ